MYVHWPSLTGAIETRVVNDHAVEFGAERNYVTLSHIDPAVLVAALRAAADQLEASTRPDRSAQARRDGCCGNPIPGSDAVCDKPLRHMGGCGLVGVAVAS